MLIAKITGAFLVLGLLIALFSPKEYSTEATLMPEAQSNQSKAGSLLQQYGGMLGISAGDVGGSEGTIPPQLYPNVVQSLPFQLELIDAPVTFSRYDTTVTPYLFFSEVHSPSVLGYVKKYTLGLPGKLIGVFKGKAKDTGRSLADLRRDSVLSLNKEQIEIVKGMRGRLTVSVDQETGVITLKSELPDPQAAAEMGHKAISLLKKYMRDYRTEKAKQDLQFVQQQVDEARNRFEAAQQQLAEFRDSNINLATAKAQTQEQELQSRYDIAFNVYNSLRQRLEQARMEVQEQTPVFTVLQPISVPLNDNTSGLLLLVVSGVLGGIVALGWVLVKNWWQDEQISFEK